MSSKTFASNVGIGSEFATGVYTGDGAATQAIVGVGFQPRFVIIFIRVSQVADAALKTNQDGLNTLFFVNFGAARVWRYLADMIISLDADGFTVGDGTGFGNVFNIAATGYTYVAFR